MARTKRPCRASHPPAWRGGGIAFLAPKATAAWRASHDRPAGRTCGDLGADTTIRRLRTAARGSLPGMRGGSHPGVVPSRPGGRDLTSSRPPERATRRWGGWVVVQPRSAREAPQRATPRSVGLSVEHHPPTKPGPTRGMDALRRPSGAPCARPGRRGGPVRAVTSRGRPGRLGGAGRGSRFLLPSFHHNDPTLADAVRPRFICVTSALRLMRLDHCIGRVSRNGRVNIPVTFGANIPPTNCLRYSLEITGGAIAC